MAHRLQMLKWNSSTFLFLAVFQPHQLCKPRRQSSFMLFFAELFYTPIYSTYRSLRHSSRDDIVSAYNSRRKFHVRNHNIPKVCAPCYLLTLFCRRSTSSQRRWIASIIPDGRCIQPCGFSKRNHPLP